MFFLRDFQSQNLVEISLIFFRAIHTNYDAKFTCDSIKMAVIKNRWLAERLGGEMYSVVFKYEQGNMNSLQNGGLVNEMFVWFEGVNYGHDGDEKSNYGDGDDNIGDVKDDGDNDNNDDDDADDNDENDCDNDDDKVIVKVR